MAEADKVIGSDTVVCAIGDWTFHPSENELRGPDGRRRLEHRAARTLQLLCARRGQVVARDEIVREVWGGRLVSANSVSIVISDLREALGDDARDPQHIETVAKRGYRLAAGQAAQPDVPIAGRPRARLLWLGSILLLLLAGAAAIMTLSSGASEKRPILVVGAIINSTGSAAYQPLASASQEVLLARAGGIEGVTVVRNLSPAELARLRTARARVIDLSAHLVLWSGKPTVMLTAADRKTGAVLWNGMIRGGEDAIPPGTAAAMQDLAAALAVGNGKGTKNQR